MKSLTGHLLGETRTAILAALLLRPDEPQHVRELARLTGVSPGTLHRELTALESLGVLRRNAVGRQVFFTANRGCPVFEELAGLLRKTAGLAGATREGRARAAGLAAKEIEFRRGGAKAATAVQAIAAGQTLHSPVATYASTTAAKGARPVSQKLRVSQTKLEALCRKYGVARLSLFGSASRNALTPESDVDLMVEFSPDFPCPKAGRRDDSKAGIARSGNGPRPCTEWRDLWGDVTAIPSGSHT